jgi:hypothetical protein
MDSRPERKEEEKRQRGAEIEKRLRVTRRLPAEEDEATHGLDSYLGEKWWEAEMSPTELMEYRDAREVIEKQRYEALVEKERERYRQQEQRKRKSPAARTGCGGGRGAQITDIEGMRNGMRNSDSQFNLSRLTSICT